VVRTAVRHPLDEVEALLERTKAMKGWLEVAPELRLRDTRGVRAVPGASNEVFALSLVRVSGRDCRRRVNRVA
jgi:hypothetical protein